MLLLLAVGMSFPVTARAAQDFIVGFDAEFPPYGYMDNGEYVGFDLDLAQGVCQRRGWNLIKDLLTGMRKMQSCHQEQFPVSGTVLP